MSTVLKANGRSLSVASIMDGHGGTQAAALCCTQLPARIESAVSSGSSIEEACSQAFALCNEEIREAGMTSGTTATVIVHDHAARRLVCCNVGSSNALLITASEVSRITVDHRLQGNAAEQERVRSAGAIVACARPDRWLPQRPAAHVAGRPGHGAHDWRRGLRGLCNLRAGDLGPRGPIHRGVRGGVQRRCVGRPLRGGRGERGASVHRSTTPRQPEAFEAARRRRITRPSGSRPRRRRCATGARPAR